MKNQGFRDPKGTASRLHLPTDKGKQKCLKNLGTHITPATSGRPGTPDREVHSSLLSQPSCADSHANNVHTSPVLEKGAGGCCRSTKESHHLFMEI